MTNEIKYQALISPVREVTLIGTADFHFWDERLRAEGLFPVRDNDQARLLIVSVDSQFMGLRFQELSISVAVSLHEEGVSHDGYYLNQAFNSLRLFSFIERTFFHTPYYCAKIQVDVQTPVSFQVEDSKGLFVRAAMSANASPAPRTPFRSGVECWKGPVFLPPLKPGSSKKQKLFFAKIAGDTDTYSFDPALDKIELKPSLSSPAIQTLIDSHFTGREWLVRKNGEHGKSKTVLRSST